MSDYINHTVTITITDIGDSKVSITLGFDPSVTHDTQSTPATRLAVDFLELANKNSDEAKAEDAAE